MKTIDEALAVSLPSVEQKHCGQDDSFRSAEGSEAGLSSRRSRSKSRSRYMIES